MKNRVVTWTLAASALGVGFGWAASAYAADTVKIGLIMAYSGPFADTANQMQAGIDLWLAEHNGEVAGKKVELIKKDTGGPSPDVAKRLAQELVVRDGVDIIAGFTLTPEALGAADVATQAKKFMVVMNAATSVVTEKSPYIVRTSMTLPQVAAPMASWAAANGIHKVYIAVADYGPGHDAAAQFKKTFTAAGGEVVGEVHTPLTSPDFAPFLQKIKDARPDAIFLFVPNGEQGVAFAKSYKERALADAGIRLLATGDVVTEDVLAAMGDNALGMITSFHYSQAHDSPENAAFVKAYAQAYPGTRPNMVAVAAYDGMRLIREALEKTQGDASGDAFMAAVKGLKWTSPRGPVEIDPQTRDIIQNVYIRKVEKVDGVLQNVEFATVEAVKDPGKM